MLPPIKMNHVFIFQGVMKTKEQTDRFIPERKRPDNSTSLTNAMRSLNNHKLQLVPVVLRVHQETERLCIFAFATSGFPRFRT